MAYAEDLAEWTHGLRFADLPTDVVEATKLRVLDVIGLTLAGLRTPFGQSVRQATVAMNAGGPCRVWGAGDRVGVTGAALVNGALSQALEYDDTHNESIVHMSSPSVAAALALSELKPTPGQDLITAIALGSEIACRVGSVAPGQFHKRGFHPTGLFSSFGSAYLAGYLLKSTPLQMANAAGIAGSFAAGLLECWVDGTQSKFLHPGWAAQSGIAAAYLGQAGTTGPKTVFEGRFGLLASHLQDHNIMRNDARITTGLGTIWDTRRASFKPYPVAHVIHPYIDLLLRLRCEHAIDPASVAEIIVPVAGYFVPIVCEPAAEKRRPKSDSHGRVSMQFTLAEAMHFGRLGVDAYQPSSLANPAIHRLADLVRTEVDPTFPGPERFKGAIVIVLKDGTRHEAVEEHNRGSAENPMSRDDIIAKFDENAAWLPASRRRQIVEATSALETATDASALVGLTVG